MSDEINKDEIRRKRLAKLTGGGNSAPVPPLSTESNSQPISAVASDLKGTTASVCSTAISSATLKTLSSPSGDRTPSITITTTITQSSPCKRQPTSPIAINPAKKARCFISLGSDGGRVAVSISPMSSSLKSIADDSEMDVEFTPPLFTRDRTISCSEMTPDVVQSILSKIMRVQWSGLTNRDGSDLLLLEEVSLNTSSAHHCVVSECLLSAILRLLRCDAKSLQKLGASTSATNTVDLHEVVPSWQSDLEKIFTGGEKSLTPEEHTISYLCSVYHNVNIFEKEYPKKYSVEPLPTVLPDVRRQCIQLSVSLLSDRLTKTGGIHAELLPLLLTDRLPRGYLSDLISITAVKDHTFYQVWSGVIQGLCSMMNNFTILDCAHRRVLEVMIYFTETKMGNNRPFCSLLVKMPSWCPLLTRKSKYAGRELASSCLLSPFLKLSLFAEDTPSLPSELLSGDNSPHNSRGRGYDVVNSIPLNLKSLSSELDHVRKDILWKIFHNMLINSASKEGTLKLLSELMLQNRRRGQMHCKEANVMTDGMAFNLISTLTLLCVKVKPEKVDATYFLQPNSLVNFDKESRLALSDPEAEEHKKTIKNTGPPSFHTSCFFLTLSAHHLSLVTAIRKYTRRSKAIGELQGMVNQLTSSEDQWKNLPSSRQQRKMLTKWQDQLKRQNDSRLCQEAAILDTNLLSRCINYYCSLAQVILSSLLGSDYNNTFNSTDSASILPKIETPKLFAAFPEFFLEDMAEVLLFVSQHHFSTVQDNIDSHLISLLLVVICSCGDGHVKNPYLTAKFVEILFQMTPTNLVPVLYQRVLSHQLSVRLPTSLMQFYTLVESMGTSNGFYDKFSMRYHVAVIFRSFWKEIRLKEAFVSEASSGKDFIKFVNLLMNDTTFLLDECLDCLKRIKDLQEEMSGPQWATLDSQQQENKTRNLAQEEKQCRWYLSLTRETLEMMHHLTKEIPKPFLRPEIGDRLAAMLNHNLRQLAGKKCSDLKVRNSEKLGWYPKKMLGIIVDVYLHLNSDEFAKTLANDERSFSKELFEMTSKILDRNAIKTVDEMIQFETLGKIAYDIQLQKIQEDEDFGDAPENYMDPLMQTIMTDPVTLPSGLVMERGVIMRHLLNDNTDPFTRQPLTEDDLVNNVELKTEIEKWLEEKRSKR